MDRYSGDMVMKVYMEITKDEYELPVAIADTPTELARLLHIDRTAVWKMLKHKHKKPDKCKYIEVEIGDDDDA